MPSLDYMDENNHSSGGDNPFCTGAWLVDQIKRSGGDLRKQTVLLVDCRSSVEFRRQHLSGAVNVSLPASLLMLRRLSNGKLQIPSLIRDESCRQKFVGLWKTHTVVLYTSGGEEDANSSSSSSSAGEQMLQSPRLSQCVLGTLFRRLEQDGCRVFCLQGGLCNFSRDFPEWCETKSEEGPIDASLLGLETLRITASNSSPSSTSSATSSSSESSECDSGLPLVRSRGGEGLDPPFPVEIVPYLFLGNAENAGDWGALERHRIQHVLNVTPNLPNAFEKQGLGIRYLKIPIEDHWSQNLASFFPQAIAFIDEARTRRQGVLVHCLAGVSRSVTVTLAYLMRTLRLPLNDAYDLVRRRKANISPNFHFLGQLLDYEGQLRLSSPSLPALTQPDATSLSPLLTSNDPGSTSGGPQSALDPESAASRSCYFPCTCPGTCPCACKARRDTGDHHSTTGGATTPASAPPCPCTAKTSALFLTSPAHATPDSGIDVDRWTE